MSQDAATVRDSLLDHNEEYQRLTRQHHQYENRLSTLTGKVVLSAEEELEEKELKKKKLELKDKMEAIARQAKRGASH